MPEETYVTVTGFAKYFGIKVFKIGKIIRLAKDRNNDYDSEAIKVEIAQIGTVGNVSNSVSTKAGGTKSAGFIYNMFDDFCYAEVLFTTQSKVIAKIILTDRDDSEELEKLNRFF